MKPKDKKKEHVYTDIKTIKESKVDKLLHLLNNPQTKSVFWEVNEPHVHIMGIRPIIRTSVEMINEHGFNPYEKKIKENLFKVFKIYISRDSKNIINEDELDIKKDIEQYGVIYIKHHDINYIYDKIKDSK